MKTSTRPIPLSFTVSLYLALITLMGWAGYPFALGVLHGTGEHSYLPSVPTYAHHNTEWSGFNVHESLRSAALKLSGDYSLGPL